MTKKFVDEFVAACSEGLSKVPDATPTQVREACEQISDAIVQETATLIKLSYIDVFLTSLSTKQLLALYVAVIGIPLIVVVRTVTNHLAYKNKEKNSTDYFMSNAITDKLGLFLVAYLAFLIFLN